MFLTLSLVAVVVAAPPVQLLEAVYRWQLDHPYSQHASHLYCLGESEKVNGKVARRDPEAAVVDALRANYPVLPISDCEVSWVDGLLVSPRTSPTQTLIVLNVVSTHIEGRAAAVVLERNGGAGTWAEYSYRLERRDGEWIVRGRELLRFE